MSGPPNLYDEKVGSRRLFRNLLTMRLMEENGSPDCPEVQPQCHVQRIWADHKLQPHRVRTFKRSTDPDFAAKLEGVVGLYIDPPRHGVFRSVDNLERTIARYIVSANKTPKPFVWTASAQSIRDKVARVPSV